MLSDFYFNQTIKENDMKSKSKNQSKGVQGGTPEQHAKAGSQSHKNAQASSGGKSSGSGKKGGNSAQQSKAGSQSSKS